jgi:hypothetical protein
MADGCCCTQTLLNDRKGPISQTKTATFQSVRLTPSAEIEQRRIRLIC